MRLEGKKGSRLVTIAAAGGLLWSGAAGAGLPEFIKNGDVKVDVRYRYEFVDQDGYAKNAKASTVRTRVGYQTGSYRGIVAYVEMEHTGRVTGGHYSVPGGSPYGPKTTSTPVVADPLFTELNQAWVEYQTGGMAFRYGRQRVTLDNHRFVGNVGWRQNEQTYDALTIKAVLGKDLKFFYGLFNNANTVIGTDRRMRSHIVNVAYSGVRNVNVVGYAYLLDFDSPSEVDTKTIGVKVAGGVGLVGHDVRYHVEYARQSDYADSTGFSADYMRGELAVSVSPHIWISWGWEKLGSDGGKHSVQTPLATLHAMNGWADQFLVTPLDGLQDKWITFSFTIGKPDNDGVVTSFSFHDFSSDRGDTDYGSEFDMAVEKGLGDGLSVGFKYAGYDAKAHSKDTKKLWLSVNAKF